MNKLNKEEEEMFDSMAYGMSMTSERVKEIVLEVGDKVMELTHLDKYKNIPGSERDLLIDKALYEWTIKNYQDKNEIYFAASIIGRVAHDELLYELLHLRYHMNHEKKKNSN